MPISSPSLVPPSCVYVCVSACVSVCEGEGFLLNERMSMRIHNNYYYLPFLGSFLLHLCFLQQDQGENLMGLCILKGAETPSPAPTLPV